MSPEPTAKRGCPGGHADDQISDLPDVKKKPIVAQTSVPRHLVTMDDVTDRLHAGGSTDDRLSALPDDVLHRIISFLPCQRAVQTTVLSKRWTGLWRSAPGINIDLIYFSIAKRFSWQVWEKMEDLVTNFLMFHNAPVLDAFRFAMDGGISADRLPVVNRWVRRGIMCCPSVLEIEIFDTDRADPFELPEIFGTSRPAPFELPDIGSASSRCLKRLSLVGVSLGSSLAEMLRSGCPALEDLYLEDCCTEFNHIQSITLNKVSLIMCYRHSVDTLAIMAPALATLELDFRMPDHAEKNEVSVDGSTNFLVNASVAYSLTNARVFPPPRCRVMLLGSLSNVTKLELTGCFSAELMLDNELGQFPIFSNLRTLSLDGCLFGNRDFIGKNTTLDVFLQKAPNLEKLTLDHHWPCCKNTFQKAGRKKRKMKTSGHSLHSPEQKVFECPYLKLIEIKYEGRYMYDHYEHQMFQVMRGLWRTIPKATFTVTEY